MKPSGVVALLTDFGTRDVYVGVMKGVVAGIAPNATVVDICHEIPEHDIPVGSLFLASAIPYYPCGTVFVAVVDPGVGSARRPLAVQTKRAWFVGPDNGILSDALAESQAVRAVDLSKTVASLPRVNHTFHGRDVFAPIAARLANGEPLERFGSPVDAWFRLPDDVPLRDGDVLRGRVVFADRFGNLVTNIRRAHVTRRIARVCLNERDCGAPRECYSNVRRGEWLALWNSFDRLEIARNGMSAARACRWRPGVEASVLVFLA